MYTFYLYKSICILLHRLLWGFNENGPFLYTILISVEDLFRLMDHSPWTINDLFASLRFETVNEVMQFIFFITAVNHKDICTMRPKKSGMRFTRKTSINTWSWQKSSTIREEAMPQLTKQKCAKQNLNNCSLGFIQ